MSLPSVVAMRCAAVGPPRGWELGSLMDIANTRSGFSVRLFVPSGKPEGPRIVEKSNWSGRGVLCSRASSSDVMKAEEWLRTGVYVLWGADSGDRLPRVYVGQSGDLPQRIAHHLSTKDWWSHCAAFASTQGLNQSQCRYIEARLWHFADAAKRCELTNDQTPGVPALTRADTVDADLFLADMLLCLKVLGVTFFETPRPIGEVEELRLEGKGIQALGYEDAARFVVRGGSRAVKKEEKSLGAGAIAKRRALMKRNVLEDCGDAYGLVQDYVFDSPTMAANVLLAAPANGLLVWKTKEGKTLGEVRRQTEAR